MNDIAVPVELIGVRIEYPTNQPIVLLREKGGERYLAIWIGASEATAIAYAMEGVDTPRPFTHDLLKIVIETLEAEVNKVTITEIRDSTYFAELELLRNGQEVVISSRPSDAIALVARTGAELYASEGVLAEAGIEIKDEDSSDAEEAVVERFREFLEDLSPEDFNPEAENS